MAFGQSMPGRTWQGGDRYKYGFNGKEHDDEVQGSGNSLDFGARIYDPRIARWLSIDPKKFKYPYFSPYVGFGDNPNVFVDPGGETLDVQTVSKATRDKFTAKIKKVFGDKANIVYDGTELIVRKNVNDEQFSKEQLALFDQLMDTRLTTVRLVSGDDKVVFRPSEREDLDKGVMGREGFVFARPTLHSQYLDLDDILRIDEIAKTKEGYGLSSTRLLLHEIAEANYLQHQSVEISLTTTNWKEIWQPSHTYALEIENSVYKHTRVDGNYWRIKDYGPGKMYLGGNLAFVQFLNEQMQMYALGYFIYSGNLQLEPPVVEYPVTSHPIPDDGGANQGDDSEEESSGEDPD